MTSKKTLKALAIAQFEKDYTALKSYMLGKEYYKALQAMAFAEQYHIGTRKNGYTPEFHHQISICWTIINLRGIDDLEEHCLALAFLHDVMEDYDISIDEMSQRFGAIIAKDVYVLSKKHRGEVKSMKAYHQELAEKAATIIVKGADNSHNVQSMHDAFTPEKIITYLEDTKNNKLPLLRLGRKRFPKYHFALTGLSFMLKRQVELYEFNDRTNYLVKRQAEINESIDRTKKQREIHELTSQRSALQTQIDKMCSSTQLADEKQKYINFATSVMAAMNGLGHHDHSKFQQILIKDARIPGHNFEMPSILLASFKNSLGKCIDSL